MTIERFDQLLTGDDKIRTILKALGTEQGDEDNFTSDFLDDLLTQLLMVATDIPSEVVDGVYSKHTAGAILRARERYGLVRSEA